MWGAVVSRLASLGHDVVAMVRDVQAASRCLPSGIAKQLADYEDASALKRALDGDACAVMRHNANIISAAIGIPRNMDKENKWCPGEDSNLHGSLHWYLKPARLPVPPPGLERGATHVVRPARRRRTLRTPR
jgi:hypothetical protein